MNRDICNFNNCEITEIIMNYLDSFVQLCSYKIDGYHINMRTTKCLNTAVVLTYLLSGKENISTIEYCDVDSIKNRFNKLNSLSQKKLLSKSILDELKINLSVPEDDRFFYYILLTNNTMDKSNKINLNQKETMHFPGHVFIIDKFLNKNICNDNINSNNSKNNSKNNNKNNNNSKNNKKNNNNSKNNNKKYNVDKKSEDKLKEKIEYKIYQSYINKYDLKGHYKKNNNSLRLKTDQNVTINYLIEGFENIIYNEVWNENAVEFWNYLTFVDTNHLVNYKTDKMFICYQKIKVNSCYNQILKFLEKELNILYKHLINENSIELKKYIAINQDTSDEFFVPQKSPYDLYINLFDAYQEIQSKLI